MMPRIGKVQDKVSSGRPQVLSGIKQLSISTDSINYLVFVRPKLTLSNDNMNWLSQRKWSGVDFDMLIIDVMAFKPEAGLALIVEHPDAW